MLTREQQWTARLLSVAIRHKQPGDMDLMNLDLREELDWTMLFEEAFEHDVHPLLWPLLEYLTQQKPASAMLAKNDTQIPASAMQTRSLSQPDPLPQRHTCAGWSDMPGEIREYWRQSFLITAMWQTRLAEQMKLLFSSFGKAGIPVLAMKGQSLRALYPHPELRSMSDADILVKPADLDRSVALLVSMGYKKTSASQTCIDCKHPEGFEIEVHDRAIDFRIHEDAGWTAKIWEDAEACPEAGETAWAMSPSWNLLQQLAHMASHTLSNGCGLRMFTDFTLTVEQTATRPDWIHMREHFLEQVRGLHLETALNAILAGCHALLDLDVAKTFPSCPEPDPHMLQHYMKMMFAAGIHGHRTSENEIQSIMLYYSTQVSAKSGELRKSATTAGKRSSAENHCNSASIPGTNRSRQKRYMNLHVLRNFLFPPLSRMSLSYGYVRNHPMLLPAGWLHRLLFELFRRDFSLREKAGSLIRRRHRSRSDEKTQVLKWMGLLP